MGNLLTQGLLAAALMALFNFASGTEPVSWDIFLAAMVAMAMNLDCGGCRVAPGSPACYSIGGGLLLVYIAGIISFLAWSFAGAPSATVLFLPVAAGIAAHLLAEVLAGETIFTFPVNIRPGTWLVRCDAGSDRFWPAWGRLAPTSRRMKDAHLNALSLAIILMSTGIHGAI